MASNWYVAVCVGLSPGAVETVDRRLHGELGGALLRQREFLGVRCNSGVGRVATVAGVVAAGAVGFLRCLSAAPDGVLIKWNAQHSATYTVTVTCLDDICVTTKSKTASNPSIKSTYKDTTDSRCIIM